MNTPDSPTPPPSDSGVPASTPPPAAPKPAFKVTRSPFAPKLQGGPGSPPAPISISATSGLSSVSSSAFSSGPTAARAPKAAPKARVAAVSSKPSMAGLVVDIIAAGIAIAFAVLIALNYFSA